MSYNFRKDIYMLEDILGYKTEEFFGYKREKRKIFSKGNREEFFNMISRKMNSLIKSPKLSVLMTAV